jgi:small subunit ribosomal protein S13|tara:strand:+ start:280 stop:759 length:480 start_codon:yes stop_codon:yes gene_type:complete
MEEKIIQNKNPKEDEGITLVRILGKDIRGDRELLPGLTNIQGISWSFANAICSVLKLDTKEKIQNIGKEKLNSLEAFAKNPKVPGFLKNRQKDFEDGEDKHIVGADLKIRKEFDVKRLRKIRSYRGSRHAFNLPVRGQRTKANFRKNRKKSGVTGVKKK